MSAIFAFSSVGSPAHAGIDPGLLIGLALEERIPRTRGDRPEIDDALASSKRDPPHTRG